MMQAKLRSSFSLGNSTNDVHHFLDEERDQYGAV